MTNVIVVFHFGLLFALLPPVPPLTAQKIQLKKKMKIRDIINLHMCTKNYD